MLFYPLRRGSLLLVFLVLFCVHLPLGAEDSLLLVVDRSASMGLPVKEAAGPTRLDAARGVLERLFTSPGGVPATAWGLISFAAEPRELLGFGTAGEELQAALAGLEPRGTSRLEPVLKEAISRLAAVPGDGRRILLLVSDCLNTGAPAAALPALEACRDAGGLELWVLGFDLPNNRPRAGRIRSWVLANNGRFFDITEGDELAAGLKEAPESYNPPAETPRPADVAQIPLKPRSGSPAPRRRSGRVWLLAAAFPAGLAALAYAYRRYRELLRCRAARAIPGSPLRLRLKQADGSRQELDILDFPRLLTTAAGRVTDLPPSEAAPDGLLLTEEEGALRCTSVRGSALLSGVARKSIRLREGACLRLGSALISVRALPLPPRPAPPPPRPLFLAWLAPLALVLLTALFLPGKTQAGIPPLVEATAETAAFPGTSGVPQAAPSSLRREPPREIGPGGTPAYFPADILCFHAHPDDESLDFGVLLGRAREEGLRTVVVIFTDGEGGNDASPGGRKLAGAGLAALRVEECTRALTCLGVEQYVRLGLKNHPYNRADQALSPAATVAAWGGEEELIRHLLVLLEGFRPRLVASPAGPAPAAEHFEHQAVGYLVARAVRLWTAGSNNRTTLFLTALDPGAASEASRLLEVPAELPPAQGDISCRVRQLLALGEYRSQYDAAVVGMTRLPNFAAEHYRLERTVAAGAETLLSALKGQRRAGH